MEANPQRASSQVQAFQGLPEFDGTTEENFKKCNLLQWDFFHFISFGRD